MRRSGTPKTARPAGTTRQCFTLMPFKPDLDELYSQVIKPIVEKTKALECLRADEIYGPSLTFALRAGLTG